MDKVRCVTKVLPLMLPAQASTVTASDRVGDPWERSGGLYRPVLSRSDPLFALPGVWRVVWINPASAAAAAVVGLDPLITLMRAGLGVLCSLTTRVVLLRRAVAFWLSGGRPAYRESLESLGVRAPCLYL